MWKRSVAAVAAVWGVAGCSPMNVQSTAAPSTPAVRAAAAATPTLAGGYKKVAAPAAAAVYFINLKDGDTVSSPVLVQFGLRGMGVAPAGIEKENTGHHHLLVDVAEVDLNNALPMTENIRHFGAGQTEVRIELKPGTHTLQLLLADQNHIPHFPAVLSERITVTVR
jgi:Domain of unknown function (DUF4399)